MATEGDLEFADREQNNEQLLEIIQMRRENSGGDTVPVQFVDTGEASDGNGALILQPQEIELNGERHVILQQAQDSETGELLVVLQGANGEPIALSSEALSSVQGLVQVSGAEGEQVITLAVSQENSDQQMVVVSDSTNSTATVAVPIDTLGTSSSRFTLSNTANKTVSNICNQTNASTNVVQSVETPRMTTHQEQSSCEPIVEKSIDGIQESLNNENDAQSCGSSGPQKDQVAGVDPHSELNPATIDSDKSIKELEDEKRNDELNGQKALDSTQSSIDFTSAVIQVQDSNGNASLETLMANAVVSAADNNYVVMTTEESGIPTEINLADMISAGSASGQTFFIETSEGLVACTSASTAEDGSIQLVAGGGPNATAILDASNADGQVIQNVGGNQAVTYTLQTTASGIELTPVTNLQSPVKQPPKPKPVRQTKPKPISTTRAGETILLPTSVTSKTVVAPVPIVTTNPKNRAVPIRNTKSATGVHVSVTPQSSYSSNVIPVQPDNSSSHIKGNVKTATSSSVASMLTSSTPAASQLAASRRTYSKKNNIVWLNPEQTTVTTVARLPATNTTNVSPSSSSTSAPTTTTTIATTPVKNKTTVSVFSGTKSSIPSSGLTIVKADNVTNDLNAKTTYSSSTPPEKKRDSPTIATGNTAKTPTKEPPKQSPSKEETKTVIVSKSTSLSASAGESVNPNAKVTVAPVSSTKPAVETPKPNKPVEVIQLNKDICQEERQKNETKVMKSEKTKEIEKKSQDEVEMREHRKKVDEGDKDNTKSVKVSNTRSSKQKIVSVEPVASKEEKNESSTIKSDKNTTAETKEAPKVADVNPSRAEVSTENEKRSEKAQLDDVNESTKILKHSKTRVQNKSKPELSTTDTESKATNIEKPIEAPTEKAKDTSETKQKESEKKVVDNLRKEKKVHLDKKEDNKDADSKQIEKTGDNEKRLSIKGKYEVADDHKISKSCKTRSSKSKELKVTLAENESSKVTENVSNVTFEAEQVNAEKSKMNLLAEPVKDDVNEKKKDDVLKASSTTIDEMVSSEKSAQGERKTRDSKRKSEEISSEKSLKLSKSRSSKAKQPESVEPKSVSVTEEAETKPVDAESQDSKSSKDEAEDSQINNEQKQSESETSREKRTRELRKKTELTGEDTKNTKTTKLKVNFKLDENESPMDIGDSSETLSSRKRRRQGVLERETPKRERGTRRSTLKNSPESEKIIPILKKTRQTPVSMRPAERVCIIRSYSNDNDEETEEIEKQRVVSSINDSRSPAERYDFTSNECHFHIRHQSTSLSPFTPRGSGGSYMCQKCGYKTSRMNNLVLHHKDQCPVVKSAVMSFWENEIRKQTRKPAENSTPVVDDHIAKKRKLDLDMQSSENYDSEGELEDDDEEKIDKLEKIDHVAQEKDNDVKPVHDVVLTPSDDEDEASAANEAKKKCFGFDEKEIVWAEFEGIFWPALVVKLHDKHKDVTVKLIDNSFVRKCVKMSFEKVKPFDNAEVNKRLLSEGKAVNGDIVKAVQKAEDYSRKRCLGDENGAAKLFEDLNECRESSDEERMDDERLADNVVANNGTKSDGLLGSAAVESDDSSDLRDLIENSAQWKERRRISNSKLLQCIKDGKIENHLLGVYRETISSDRHIKFKSGSDAEKSQLKHVPWFGPIDDEDQQEEIYDYCSQLFKSNFKPDGSFDTVAYLFEVWVPEAIVKAISRIRRIELKEAEAIFAKGVILSKSEKVELEKEILKEAEKQATTNTSPN